MALFGTIVNGICIIVGSLIGVFFTKIPERYKETVMQAIGLVVILIGLQMAFQADVIVILLVSLLSGALIGEWLHIEEWLNQLGEWIGSKFRTKGDNFSVAQGFVTASLIFGIGAMSILGALDSGLRGDHEILITKGVIDGFTALVLTTTLGFGVIFSVIPVVLYEGLVALLATQIENWLPKDFLDGFIVELTAVGGLMIVAIGLNLLKLTNIRIGNLLPALVTVGIIFYIYQLF
ncbi:DUF554 domain-containing protein [Lentibacillus sp. N15]|uniref:DUF554 domain-containing protein n=1 Tax=Lentibacillus songyuanensis TaxID=3136161 RepID=UPI0031BBC871